jgi:hypothetical protein
MGRQNITFTYVQLKNGILKFKCNSFSILSCEFRPYIEDIKAAMNLDAVYIEYPRATKIKKIKDKSEMKINIVGLSREDIKREAFEIEILVPLEKDMISPMAIYILPFYKKLTLIFGDADHVKLFLHYVAELLFLNTDANNPINPLTNLIILNDANNIVKKLINLIMPNFEEIGTVSNIFMFEKESWKKDKHLETIMNNNILDKVKGTIFSSKYSIITHRSIQHTRILKIQNQLGNFNLGPDAELQRQPESKYSSILLFTLINTLNSSEFRITKGIKNKHKNNLSIYLNSFIGGGGGGVIV